VVVISRSNSVFLVKSSTERRAMPLAWTATFTARLCLTRKPTAASVRHASEGGLGSDGGLECRFSSGRKRSTNPTIGEKIRQASIHPIADRPLASATNPITTEKIAHAIATGGIGIEIANIAPFPDTFVQYIEV
jgi:hypothetical protein